MRYAHFVGSSPFDSPEEAMSIFLESVGGHLRTLPDGETGPWALWFKPALEAVAAHPGFEWAANYGSANFQDYDHVPRLKAVDLWRLPDPASVDILKERTFREDYPVFRKLRAERGLDRLRFQVGLPGDWDMEFFLFGIPYGPAWYHRLVVEVMVREITAIVEAAPDDVVIQLETPFMQVPILKAPAVARRGVAGYFAKRLATVARRCPLGTRFGIHLCVGDLHREAVAKMKDVQPAVDFANAIAARWPEGRPLEFLHLPFAAGADPAPLDEAYYGPLARLRVPEETRIIAGFVHETRTLDEQTKLLATFDRLVGRPVDVANACGLGRLTREQATQAITQTAELVSVPFADR